MNNIWTIILAGGKGMRLASNKNTPKPLVLINNEPMIWELIVVLQKQGFQKILICLGFGAEAIINFFKKRLIIVSESKNKNIFIFNFYYIQIVLLNTGENSFSGHRLFQAMEILKINEPILLCYSDGFTDANFNDFFMFHNSNNYSMSILGIQPKIQYGVINSENHASGVITSFEEKPRANYWISGGFFFIEGLFLKKFLKDYKTLCFETEIIPAMVETKLVGIWQYFGDWLAVDTQKDLENLQRSQLWKKLQS